MSKDIQKTALRLPRDLHTAIHEAADASGRTMNAEIVYRLQRTFADDAEFADGDGARYIEGLRIVPKESQAMKFMAARDDALKRAESLLLEVRDLLKEKEEDK